MTSPSTYAKWAERADPNCPICRGMGYARYRQQSTLSAGELLMRGLNPPSGTYESACECLGSPEAGRTALANKEDR